jgi:amino acid adenylation domain-containing protein
MSEQFATRADGTAAEPTRPGAGSAAPSGEAPRTYPLTPLQHGMLFQSLRAPGSGLNVEQVVCTLREAVDEEGIRRAWTTAVARHDVLRARFAWTGMPQPVHVVQAEAAPEIAVHDLARPGFDHGLEHWLEEDRARGFDLARDPAMRLTLFRRAADEWVLVWTFHHLILDGASVAHVLREVFALYEGGGKAELPARRPFRDHVAWVHGRDPAEDEVFWTEWLRGVSAAEPPRGARAHPRDPAAEPPFGARELRLSAEATAALRAFEQEQGVWLSTLVQAAWALLLGRCSDRRDVVFGAVRGGRATGVEGVEGMVGMLINTVPVRVLLPDDARVTDWLDEIGDRLSALVEHEHSALPDVARWSGIAPGAALFDTILDYQARPFDAELGGLGGAWAARELRVLRRTGFPLAVAVTGETPLQLRLDYDAEHFDGVSAERMLERFANLLAGIAENPDQRLGAVDPLPPAERHLLLHAWNRPETRLPVPRTHLMVAEQAARTPDALAVACGGKRVGYGELDTRAERLARRLAGLGVGPEVRVGLCLERGVEMVVAVLAVWKARGAYVPIDPDAPPERLAWLLQDCAPAVVVTQARLASALPAHGGATVLADEAWDGAEAADVNLPPSSAEPDGLAYVIYTSGSTGTPKGVAVHHGALSNHVRSAADAVQAGPADVGIVQAAYTFDLWVLEVFPPLVAGGSVRILASGELLERERVPAALAGATLLNGVPAVFRQVVDAAAEAGGGALSALRHVAIGGDRVPPELLAELRRALPARAVLRVLYGPTETTVVCTGWTVPADGRVEGHPIGTPLPNLRAYVCGAGGTLLPGGTAGELWVGGLGVARGYLGRPALTAAAFVPDPFGPAGGRLYRSGDRVRHLSDGTLDYLGRVDEQVKIRGFRVEPGEVEAVLRRHPGVTACAVVGRDDGPGGTRLVAYLTGDAGAGELRPYLRRTLPGWMVPSIFVAVDRLPLGTNGKVDRRALPAPPPAAAQAEHVAPRTAVERVLAGIWAEVLGLELVGVRDDFLELGGHSLLATRVVSRIRAALQGDVTVASLFQHPTIEQLAPLLAERAAAPSADPAPGLADRSPQQLLSQLDQLSDEELDRLLATHT